MPTDKLAIRIVVITLAVAVVGSLALMGLLALSHTDIPEVLDRAFTASLTGLLALLARTTSSHGATDEPVPVTVTEQDVPVPVVATDDAPEVETQPVVPGPFAGGE